MSTVEIDEDEGDTLEAHMGRVAETLRAEARLPANIPAGAIMEPEGLRLEHEREHRMVRKPERTRNLLSDAQQVDKYQRNLSRKATILRRVAILLEDDFDRFGRIMEPLLDGLCDGHNKPDDW